MWILYLTVIAVYATTLDAAEETKYSFYDDLQDAVGRVPAGNWNARPGPVDAATWYILDQLTAGTRWANGDHLVNFASANCVVFFSTRFQHSQRHLVTRFSNDGRTRNQIDHMLVWCRWASSEINCRASNGAQTGSEYSSDHAKARARLRLRGSNRPAKVDTAKLNRVALEHFRLNLRNRFECLQLDEDASAKDKWRELKYAVADAS